MRHHSWLTLHKKSWMGSNAKTELRIGFDEVVRLSAKYRLPESVHDPLSSRS